MTFTLNNFELYLFIFVRITGFIYTAPFFSLKDVPFKVKAGLCIFLAAIVFYTVPPVSPSYNNTIEFAIIIVKEAIAGAIMGLFANIAFYILNFSGQLMDMDIGFSMISELDPATNMQSTITANLYGYLVLLIMMITNLHHFFIKALVDSYQVIGIGKEVFSPSLYKLMAKYMTDYFIIGFRIVLPVFASILIVNTVLAILAKVAPQINMFVIGMQLKVFIGLIILVIIISLVPSVSDFIFNEMMKMLKASIHLMVNK